MTTSNCSHGSCLCELNRNIEFVVHAITERVETKTYEKLGAVCHYPSSYPNYASKEARLASFADWKFSIPVEDLVSTGLYSTRIHDIVCCFHCGVTLGVWEEDDDPLEQHLKASPDCEYLLLGSYSNEASDEAMACKICLTREKNILFLPCGHFVSCNGCVFQLKTCPVCRSNIHGVHRVYNS